MIVELSIPIVLAVAAGGALGAAARFLLDFYFRWGILISNVIASLLMGLLVGVIAADPAVLGTSVLGTSVVALCSAGFSAGLSTFATVALRAAQMWSDGHPWHAAGLWAIHGVSGLAACGLAAWCGWLLGSQ